MRMRNAPQAVFIAALIFASIGKLFAQADLSLNLTQQPASPQQYSLYSISATVSNDGPENATNVVVSIPSGNGIVYQGGNEFSASAGTFSPYGNQTWTLSSLNAGSSETITINYFLSARSAPDSYAQIIASDQADPDSSPGNGTPPTVGEDDEASTAINGGFVPDLTLSNLSLVQNPVDSGQQVDFNFDINNIGPGSVAQNFIIQAYISTDATISADDLQNGTVPTGNFAPGQTVAGVLGVSVPVGLSPGNYFLILEVDANGQVLESNESNNEIAVPFQIQSAVVTCQIGLNSPAIVTCNDNGTPIDPSDDRFAVEVNASNGTSTGTYAVQFQGQGILATSAFGNAVTFDGGLIGSLAGTDLTYTIVESANPSCSNTFTVSIPAPCSNNNGSGDIDLSVSITQSPGQPAQYSLYSVSAVVTNSGSESATGVVIDLPIPSGVVYQGGNEFSASQGQLVIFGSDAGVWNAGTIDAGQSADITINYFLTASASSDSYVEVLAANEQDIDSTPGNGNGQVNEDDEASTGVITGPTCNIIASIQSIDCDDQGTPIETDDTYSVTFLVENGGATGTWTADNGGANPSFGGSYGVPYTLQGGNIFNTINLGGLTLSINISDDLDASCATTLTWQTPGATCSSSADPCDALGEYQISLAGTECSTVSTSPEGIVKVIYAVGSGIDSFTFDGPAELGVTPVDNNTFLAGDVICTSNGFAVVGTFRDNVNPGSAQPFLFMLDGAGAVVEATIPPFASSYTDILDFNIVDVATFGAGGDILYVEVFAFSRSYQLAAFDANANLLWEDQRIGDLVTNRIGGSVLSADESTIYFSYRDGNSQFWSRFRGVDALTGVTLWEQQLALLQIANPTSLISGNVSKPLAMQNGDGSLVFSLSQSGILNRYLAQFDPLGNVVYTTPLQSLVLSAPVYAGANDVVVLDDGNELSVYEGGNLVNCNGSATGVDLELAAVSAQSQPAIFDVNNITFTLTNTGTEAATGIAVDIPLPAGVVYTGGNEFTANQGSFNPYGNQVWTVGDLAAGATSTIVINYYSLSAAGYEQYAEVSMANEQDIDSTPGNGTGLSAQEDDEVFLSLNAPIVMPLTFYPNPLPQGEQIILDFVSSDETTQTVLFSDLTGRPVQRIQVTFVEGRNQIPVDLGILPAGVYMVAFPKSGLSPKRIIVQE